MQNCPQGKNALSLVDSPSLETYKQRLDRHLLQLL